MKHLKLYENSMTVDFIKNTLKNCTELFIQLKPLAIKKYNELADDDSYEAEMGDEPYQVNVDYLTLKDIYYNEDGIEFYLVIYDRHDDIEADFYVFVTNEEIDNFLLKKDAQKYNL